MTLLKKRSVALTITIATVLLSTVYLFMSYPAIGAQSDQVHDLSIIEEATTEEETTEPEEVVTEEVSREWKSALGSARSYIRFMSFSQGSLVRQLEFEGFPSDAINWAMEQMDKEVDWYEQAVLSAESYLRFSNFSKSGLVGQLVFDGFTDAQAQHGANVAFE